MESFYKDWTAADKITTKLIVLSLGFGDLLEASGVCLLDHFGAGYLKRVESRAKKYSFNMLRFS